MLPSTGYFKGINCPFYDSGLCERPYCHFRHVKKETQSITNDGIEDGTLQKLVSAAVQKVLQQTDTSGMVSPPQVTTADIANLCASAASKVSYNPTPISELNKINSSDLDKNDDGSDQQKKHIPIPYTPRKPSIPIKRHLEINGSNTFTFIPPAKYSPGAEGIQVDQYTPKGTVESTEKYLPGKETTIQEYTPDETQKSNKHNYVPSDKTTTKKKVLEYKPMKVAAKSEQSSVTYQPTPKSLVPCFSSDEEEVDTKKRKLSTDLNGLDDLGPEFDILDQILDEEKPDLNESNLISPIKESLKDSKENVDISKKDKIKLDKINKTCEKLFEEKSNSVVKESKKNSSSKEKDKKERHHKSLEEKSSHKKSNDKEEKRVKSEKKSHSSSKSSHSSSKKSHERSKSSCESSKSLHESSKSSHKNSKSSCDSSKQSQQNSKSSRDSSKSSKNQHYTSESKSKHKSSKDEKKRHETKKSKQKDYVKNQKIFEVENLSDDSNRIDDIVDESNNLSESDEETITEECKRIFEEYIPSQKSESIEESNNKDEENIDEYYIPTKKRISRTCDKNIKVMPKILAKPDFKVNAAQAMAERLAKVREYHASKTSNQSSNMILKPDVVKNYFSASANGNSKVRIAHVPYASTLLSAKKIITPGDTNSKSNLASTSGTITQTVKKGAQRVAHVPNEKFIDRPGVLEPLASKIPANIRSTYLNMMIDNCLKIYLSATDAYARAQHEELTTSKKCSTVPIYKNSAVLTISRLKKEVLECDGIKKSGSECAALKRMPEITSNKSNSAGSWSIESKNKKNIDDSKQFSGAKFYNNISKWILTEEQLKENGFPRPHESGQKGRAIIYGQNKQKPPKGFIRTCCRCKKDYTVDKKGFPAVKQECIYHPNNKYRVRGEVRYQCCSQDGSSDGCCIASSHVYEYVDFDNLKGFVKTLPSDVVRDDYGVYSLDCEMCYTTHGLDLTRVTIINSDCKVVYETLIKPLHPIIDYNTRYSGITEEQMEQVKTTLLEVQATLLTMFNSKTILIGHSLESDFKALKLIHDTVIDTSVLFPHKMGPPYKRALRNLSSEYLKKIIQNSVDGHDSAEDATVCMELLRFKLKEDLKTR